MSAVKPMVFVVGIDFGPRSDDALMAALNLAQRCGGAQIYAVLVIDPADVVRRNGESREVAVARQLAAAPTYLERRVEVACTAYFSGQFPGPITVLPYVGKPADGLRRAALDCHADLLIVGTQDRGRVARMLRPSVAARLVGQAPCPVLIARPKQDNGEEDATARLADVHLAPEN